MTRKSNLESNYDYLAFVAAVQQQQCASAEYEPRERKKRGLFFHRVENIGKDGI